MDNTEDRMAVLQQRLVPAAGKDGGVEPFMPAYGTGAGGGGSGVAWRCFALAARSAEHADRIGARASASDGLCIVEVSAAGVSISSADSAGAAGKALADRLRVRPMRATKALTVPAADLAGAQRLGSHGVEVVWCPRDATGGCCGGDAEVTRQLNAFGGSSSGSGGDAVPFLPFDKWPQRRRTHSSFVPLGPVDPAEPSEGSVTASLVRGASAARARAMVAAVVRVAREAGSPTAANIPGMGAASSALEAAELVRAFSRRGASRRAAAPADWVGEVSEALAAAELAACRLADDPAGVDEAASGAEAAAAAAALAIAPPRRALVVLSGASGQGKADSKWDGVWRPVLAAGGWVFEEHHTLREFHATELVAEHADPSRHWCVVPVGGDGIINEVCQALLGGDGWREGRLLPLAPMPAGSGNAVVASMCLLAKESSAGPGPALLAVRGRPVPLDASSVLIQPADASGPAVAMRRLGATPAEPALAGALADAERAVDGLPSAPGGAVADADAMPSAAAGAASAPATASAASTASAAVADGSSTGAGTAGPAGEWWTCPASQRRFMVLSGEWALPADLDLESESLRCLGAQRFVAAALLRLMCLRRYQGTISFVRARGPGLEALQRAATGPAPGGAALAVPPPLAWMMDECAAVAAGEAIATAAAAAEEGGGGLSGAPLRYLRPFAGAGAGGATGDAFAAASGGGASKGGDAAGSAGGEWETWTGEWTYLWSMQLPHQSWDVSSVPFARPGDGIVWLALMRGRDEASCCATTCALLDLDGVGSASRHDCLHLIPCAAFRVDPELPPWTRNVALDGERVPYGPFQCEVHRGLSRILA